MGDVVFEAISTMSKEELEATMKHAQAHLDRYNLAWRTKGTPRRRTKVINLTDGHIYMILKRRLLLVKNDL